MINALLPRELSDLECPQDSRKAYYVASYCKTCGGFTRERKDYCTEHVEQMPYIADLLQRIKQQEKQNTKARNGKPEITSETAKDILGLVKAGKATIKGMSVALGLPSKVILSYVRAMSEKGLVELKEGKHGVLWVV